MNLFKPTPQKPRKMKTNTKKGDFQPTPSYKGRGHATERLTAVSNPPAPFKPKYKKLRFKTEPEFKRWLNATYSHKINLFDAGDISTIWVDAEGEILNCDFHGGIYNGAFIAMEHLHTNAPLSIYLNGEWKVYAGLVAESINIKGK